jgi:regulator of protease activity HflC (stomatin/prohibitin superfamily)
MPSQVIPVRLGAALLLLGLAFLAGYYVAWPLTLLVGALGAFLLVRVSGVYRALPSLLLLTVGTAFLLGGGLSQPMEFRAGTPIRETIYNGIVSRTPPAEIIIQVGHLVDSRRVPPDSVQTITQRLEEIQSEVEDLRVRTITDRLTSIRARVEAQGIAREALVEAEQQAREQAVNREEELIQQLAAEVAEALTLTITAAQLRDFVLGGSLAAAIAVAASFIVGMACAEVLVVHRGGSRPAAYRMMAGLMTAPLFSTASPLTDLFPGAKRSFRAHQIVQDGQVIYSMPSHDDFRVPGPGVLAVRFGNAVVLERSGRITRILGPGFYLTEPFEHLSSIIDLSLQSTTRKLEDVLTKDSVPLQVELTLQYRIMIDQPALVKRAECNLDEASIRRAILTTVDWKTQTEIVAECVVRDTVASRYLVEIYDPRSLRSASGTTARAPLQHEVRRRLSRESQCWGVEAVRVNIDKVTLPPAVEQRIIEAWDVTWHEVLEIARALTEVKKATTRAVGNGRAAYLEAVNAAQARLKAAGVDHLISFRDAEPAAEAVDQPDG